MFFLEDLKVLLLWLIATVVSVNLLFLCSVLYRRLSRHRYFLAKDAAAARYQQVVAEVIAGSLTVEQGAAMLRAARSRAERAAAEESLLARQSEAQDDITSLLFALGYVHRWARAAFGWRRGKRIVEQALQSPEAGRLPAGRAALLPSLRSMRLFAVPRALAIERLGRLPGRLGQRFMAEALRDPAPEVRQLAVSMLGRHRSSQAVPLLLKEMRKSVEKGSDVSLRTAKTALAAYQPEDFDHFIPLVGHSNPQMRFVVVDTIREICNQAARKKPLGKNDFPWRLYEAMLERAEDPAADVRARTAGVIRYFRDRRATEALRKLLRDESEFVRLHAVRTIADPFYQELLPDLAARLTDLRWRVREAAARSLMAHGPGGRSRLYREFISSSDRYASEQMADEIQRVGAVDDLVSALSAGGDEADLAEAVARKLAAIGKRALLTAAVLSSSTVPKARLALMETLTAHPDEEFIAALQFLSERDAGAVRHRALALLGRVTSTAAGISVAVAAGQERA